MWTISQRHREWQHTNLRAYFASLPTAVSTNLLYSQVSGTTKVTIQIDSLARFETRPRGCDHPTHRRRPPNTDHIPIFLFAPCSTTTLQLRQEAPRLYTPTPPATRTIQTMHYNKILTVLFTTLFAFACHGVNANSHHGDATWYTPGVSTACDSNLSLSPWRSAG
ncbi:DNA polymerase lambda [Coprinopsis cinerea AmutBmut pab1-1]|nr:DNA polymerase lambda [Coprinopsis cinerea AmutBmut pab1-1]